MKLLSHVRLLVTTWTVAHQAPPSMGFFQARVLEWGAIAFSDCHTIASNVLFPLLNSSSAKKAGPVSTLFALIFPKLSTAPGTQEGLQTWFLNEGSNKKQVELKLGSGSPDPAHSSTHQHTVSLPRHVVNQTLLSKVDNPLVGAPGTKSVPGDCSEHQNYVENVLLFKHNIQFSLQSPRALLIWRGVGWGLKCNEWLIFSKWHISFMMHDCNRGCLKPAVPSSAKKKKK